MDRITITLIVSVLLACGAQSLENKKVETKTSPQKNNFNNYWYQGKAELNRFELSQARYGEIRKGDAIMVFVTEDFLKEKQVKKESNTNEKAVSVLKLNYITKFNTGIYDYSMMSSIFSPVRSSNPIKITTSSQEWCGHSWLQMNNKNGVYSFIGNSYFEKEGDSQINIEEKRMEDGLWNQIRMNPEGINEGTWEYIPSTQYLRLVHKDITGYQAVVTKDSYTKEDLIGENLMSVKLEYPSLERTLEIIYENEFPHEIAGWKETRKSGFGSQAKILETTAKRTHQIREPYWNLNKNADLIYRDKLGLN